MKSPTNRGPRPAAARAEAPEAARAEAGFTMLELLIAVAISLVLMTLTSTLLAGSFNARAREDQRSAALADAQRALNIMSREIANSGFGLSNNGLVAADSGTSTIRIRANLNAFDREATSGTVSDADEDVRYALQQGGGDSYVLRLDVNTGALTTVFANRVDSLVIRYFPGKVSYAPAECDVALPSGAAEVAQKSEARYIVISVCVLLPEVGRPGAPGYQAPSRVQLTSDVTIRNRSLTQF
ncbi:MAG TPA: type II secretion system protein [Pyrinomonadaceae bacterium]|nr:type II secretion system protein [Pyrinomonadaceae bacterium]